jgi:hypothetical protein
MMTQEVQKRITTFLSENEDMVVFILDPQTNTFFGGFKDRVIARQIVDKAKTVDQVITKSLNHTDGGRERGELTLIFGGVLDAIARDATSLPGRVKQKLRKAVSKMKGQKIKVNA